MLKNVINFEIVKLTDNFHFFKVLDPLFPVIYYLCRGGVFKVFRAGRLRG